MADDKRDTTGRGLQDSQSGGGSGDFGGNMDQQQRAGQAGGGAGPSDVSNAGGSSGTGGYGNSQNAANHQGQQEVPGQAGLAGGQSDPAGSVPGQSRGERYDEEQGGGRGPESVSPDDDEIAADQQAHQDRGQSEAEFEREQS